MSYDTESFDLVDEFQHRRLEALDRLDHCLREGSATPLESWLQAQIVQSHDVLYLLAELSETLQSRMARVERAKLDNRAAMLSEEQMILLTYLHSFVTDWMTAVRLWAVRSAWSLDEFDLRQ
jgi:hypothetical protein